MLPIDAVLPELSRALSVSTRVVLEAPPGAGKTTGVPPALLGAPWLSGRSILMLEPRRLAARAAAQRMATLRHERVGATVGYRVRMDAQVGTETRIEVVTEGILTRRLQYDPALEGVGLLIFDEFHERSINTDLGLALSLEAQAALREDLRLLVMSATLDGAAVAKLLGDAPVVSSLGRQHPVETVYLDTPVRGRIEPATAQAVRRALAEEPGSVLVFLPGAGEIRRTHSLLEEGGLPSEVDLFPLFGNLTRREQDAAIAPSPPGRRKVVLATAIAETSLTIEGIRVVIDAGLLRRPRFDVRSGMTRLVTEPVTLASADQRRGRAGRLGPGVCYRLWTRADHARLRPFTPPEILDADLAPLALELACWGSPDPAALTWLDPPPAAPYGQAQEVLAELEALDGAAMATKHGRAVNRLGLHPRLGHMLLAGLELGQGAVAADLAALLSERDIFSSTGGPSRPDVRLRLEALRRFRAGERVAAPFGHRFDPATARQVVRLADLIGRRVGLGRTRDEGDVEACGQLLALAYPDRVAQRRAGEAPRYRLRSGRGAALDPASALADAPYLVAAHLDGSPSESRVYLAAPLAADELEMLFASQIETLDQVFWDEAAERVVAVERRGLGALTLSERPLRTPDPEAVGDALLGAIRARGIDRLPWSAGAQRLRARLAFLHHHDRSWPDVSDAALDQTLEGWLQPHLYGLRTLDGLARLDLGTLLLDQVDGRLRARLDELAPTHVTVPSGSRRPIDYSNPEAPVLAVRLQEMFGATETPRLLEGAVPLTLHLLSPAQRPVQVTQDLASFWRSGYFDVRRDLRGRYPKHPWPDDPLAATPTHRAKRRR